MATITIPTKVVAGAAVAAGATAATAASATSFTGLISLLSDQGVGREKPSSDVQVLVGFGGTVATMGGGGALALKLLSSKNPVTAALGVGIGLGATVGGLFGSFYLADSVTKD